LTLEPEVYWPDMSRLPWLLLLFIVAGVPVARAADAPNTARAHFEKGSTAYDLGQFREAAREYEIAYRLKNDPALLYNIGQAYRFAGDTAEALRAYKAYLRRSPEAPNRREVDTQIVKLQRLVDEQRTSTTSPPHGVATPDHPLVLEAPQLVVSQPVVRPAVKTPIYKKWWLWTIVGVVVVGAVVGGTVAATTPNDAPGPANTFNVVLR